ncbi:MAG: DUF86 domain-containing protein [Chitinophagaceae bacterium]|nr:DUF86 domain-containing protein [Chitinophagaceae bacterium]
MPDRPAKILLEDVLEAIAKIEKYTAEFSLQEFSASDMVMDAVVRNIEVIGEACEQLPASFLNEHTEVEWHKPVSMRNRLIHGYFSVDTVLLWNTVTAVLPGFKKQITHLLNSL